MNIHRKNFSHSILNRRIWLVVALTFPFTAAATQLQTNLVEVWKDPNCGCCKDWVTTLEKSGFSVRVFGNGNKAIRAQLGMPAKLGSCHTARIGGYVIEGHVPVREIRRLLREQPKAIGLTVPGMVVGSPGMDGPVYKGRKDPALIGKTTLQKHNDFLLLLSPIQKGWIPALINQ